MFADWLDELNENWGEVLGPEWNHDRAQFIRVQIARAHWQRSREDLANSDAVPLRTGPDEELRALESALLAANEAAWTAPFRGLASGLVFRRGFVEEANVAARQFLSACDRVFATGPIRHLHLLDVGGSLPSVFQTHYLNRLTGLTIHAQYAGEPLARAVSDCPYLIGLLTLRVSRNRLTDEGVEHLATSPHLTQLEELDLSENELGEVSGQLLADSAHLSRLRRLELAGNRLGPAGATALARSGRLETLSYLGLAGNNLGNPRLHTPHEISPLLRVPQLNLSSNGLDAVGLLALLSPVSEPPLGPSVRELDLSHNALGDEGAVVISRSPSLSRLRVLRLVGCGIGDRGAAALAESPYLTGLRELNLENNPLSDAGVRPFLSSATARGLVSLGVPRIGISSTMQRLVAARYPRLGA